MGHSDMDYDELFEGCEKCLDLIFKFTASDKNLRSIPRSDLDKLVGEVGATIVSKMSCEYIDSYVLSESSLFVWSDRIVLKTCGTTVPLLIFNKLFQVVKKCVGHFEIKKLFYSRKCFVNPHSQLFPHRTKNEEHSYLTKFFPDGQLSIFNSDSDAEWIVYVYENHSLPCQLTTTKLTIGLQVMMWNLDVHQSMGFYAKVGDTFDSITDKFGIDEIIPNSCLDGFVFNPCGYSMNGLKDECYQTIHVTPQRSCSYASFECNISEYDLLGVLEKVVKIFKPANLIAALFHQIPSSSSTPLPSSLHKNLKLSQISGESNISKDGHIGVYYYSKSI